MEGITYEQEILIESVLYKQILAVSEGYVLQGKMSDEYKQLICGGISLNAVDLLSRFCLEQGLDQIGVIQKLRTCLPTSQEKRQKYEIYDVIEKALVGLEGNLQKEKEEKKKAKAREDGEER